MVASVTGTPTTRSLAATLNTPRSLAAWLSIGLAIVAFVALFQSPARGLVHDWLTDDESSYGLLLFPVALWLAWREGLRTDTRPNVMLGTAFLIAAVLLRALGSLAAELFSQRFSIWLAIVGLIVFCFGWRQVKSWWLPLALLALSIPFPAMITNVLAIPLQYRASRLGTALIEWRHIPVRATGNVISIPGQQLFVAEACSGLRSLTALIALGVMVGGMWLTTAPARIFLLLISIPVAVVINGIRVFLTAFLMYFVDPALGKGFMHESQGWGLFLVSLLILAAITFVVRLVEERIVARWGKNA